MFKLLLKYPTAYVSVLVIIGNNLVIWHHQIATIDYTPKDYPLPIDKERKV